MKENVYSLDTYNFMVNSDIDKLNEYDKVTFEALTARGERCDEIISNMLNVYMASGDKEFVS